MCQHLDEELRQALAEQNQAEAIRTVRAELDREPVRGEPGPLAVESLDAHAGQGARRSLVGATH